MSAVAPIDGIGNNLTHPEWGASGQTLLRVSPPAYGDGVSTPAGADRPSAREISNVLSTQTLLPGGNPANDARYLTAFAYSWGQFIDHDLDLTNPGTGAPSGRPTQTPMVIRPSKPTAQASR